LRHYRTHAENWDGGFSRSKEADEKALAVNPMPTDTMIIRDLKVNGHQLTYNGRLSLVFRTDEKNQLIAFEGNNCKEVAIDGIRYEFSQKPFRNIAFMPINNQPGNYTVQLTGEGKIALPLAVPNVKKPTVTCGKTRVPFIISENKIEIEITKELSGKVMRIENVKNVKSVKKVKSEKKSSTWIDTLGSDSR
jgi:hypothetical protein